MSQPLLKQFDELSPTDFETHPVWIACHSVDDDEPWFDDTDEETFRPWTGALPASPQEGMLLARASFQTADGQRFEGFVTPSFKPGELGTQQPQIFVASERFGFWGGLFGVPESDRQRFYDLIGKPPGGVFPLRYSAEPGWVGGSADGLIEGFHRIGQSPER